MKEITGFMPGPWKWTRERDSKGNVTNSFNGLDIVIWDSSNDTWIGWIYTHGDGEANAALIAAAPDLYAECQTLRTQRDALKEALYETQRHIWEAHPDLSCKMRAHFNRTLKQIQTALDAVKEKA
jgi:hypothetical protein